MPYADPDQQRAYQRDWAAARRAKWLTDNGPCTRCGATERLEVDHVDPGMKVSHRVWSWSDDRRAAELAKCQVLCEDCHLEKTYGEFSDQDGHGSRRAYDRGCRCEGCKTAARLADRARRARAKQRIAEWKAGYGRSRRR